MNWEKIIPEKGQLLGASGGSVHESTVIWDKNLKHKIYIYNLRTKRLYQLPAKKKGGGGKGKIVSLLR